MSETVTETPTSARHELRERTAEASFKVVKGIRERAVSLAMSDNPEDRYRARNMGSEIASAERAAMDNMDAFDEVDQTQRDIGDGSNLVENETLAESMAYATDPHETKAAKVRQDTLAGLHPDSRLNGLSGYNERPSTARMERVDEIKAAQRKADAIARDMQLSHDQATKY